jgi:hypothetical protein
MSVVWRSFFKEIHLLAGAAEIAAIESWNSRASQQGRPIQISNTPHEAVLSIRVLKQRHHDRSLNRRQVLRNR